MDHVRNDPEAANLIEGHQAGPRRLINQSLTLPTLGF
jgi:hypothetical protein